MNSFILNIVYTSLYITIFYAVYYIFFRKEKVFYGNRMYILFGLLASIVLPHISFPTTVVSSTSEFHYVIDAITVTPNQIIENRIDNLVLISVTYIFVAIVLGLMFVSRLLNVVAVIKGSKKVKQNGYTLVLTNKVDYAFSFFKYLVVSDAIYNSPHFDKIVAHELIHIKQKHSLDSILLELACIVMWFNPFIWMMRTSLKTIHEYLADNGVLKAGYSHKSYQIAILEQSFKHNYISITQNFNSTKLTKRVIMMNKEKTTKMVVLKSLVAMPLLLFVCLLVAPKVCAQELTVIKPTAKVEKVAVEQNIQQEEEEEVYLHCEKMPLFQGGNLNDFRNWVQANLKYPEKAAKNRTQGVVYVGFIVNKTGDVSKIAILKGKEDGLSEEVIRVISESPKWVPGEQRGKKVAVKYTLPVAFHLK